MRACLRVLSWKYETFSAFEGTGKEILRGSVVTFTCTLSETDLVASFSWSSKKKAATIGMWHSVCVFFS